MSDSSNSPVIYKSLDFLGFPRFRVGNDSSVWRTSLSTGEWILSKQHLQNNGYMAVCIENSPKSVARLVLLAFVGPCPEGMEACHNNGNRLDNKLTNLRWDTHQNNINDRHRQGGHTKGEVNGNSIRSAETILRIRKLYASGEYKQKELAKMFGTSQGYISNIITRFVWKHI